MGIAKTVTIKWGANRYSCELNHLYGDMYEGRFKELGADIEHKPSANYWFFWMHPYNNACELVGYNGTTAQEAVDKLYNALQLEEQHLHKILNPWE